ncbi:MAG: hypothetical protein WCW31_04035 [Patescibacteria group bacterium]
MSALSAEDRRTYDYLLSRKILKRVLPDKIPPEQARKGMIAVFCPDGDQFADVFGNIAEVCLQHMPWPRIHALTRMGGALVIPDNNPLSRGQYGAQLVEDIFLSHSLKDIETIALYAHAPCGAAKMAKLNLAQVLDLLTRAKLQMKDEIKRLKLPLNVICFVHIDRGDEGKRTYFFPVGEWRLITGRMPVIPGHAWPPDNINVQVTSSTQDAI